MAEALVAGGALYKNAVIFVLDSVAKYDRRYVFRDWVVEISASCFVAARTASDCRKGELFKLGYDACERALDLYSKEGLGHHFITEPLYRHIDYYTDGGRRYIDLHDVLDIPIDVSCEVTVFDKDGNIKREPSPLQPVWQPIFRYYRFSQTSSNVYDGYRWMYLLFEMLMQEIEPIKLRPDGKSAEGERNWLARALATADASYKWSSGISLSRPDCIDYFLTSQYDGIRCRLFHSKGGHILPNEQLEQQTVKERLSELQELCLFLLNHVYPVKERRGGVTYSGFERMMRSSYSQTTAFISDAAVEPGYMDGTARLGDSAVILDRTEELRFAAPGVAECVYYKDFLPKSSHSIRHYGINRGKTVLSYGDFSDAILTVDEVDRLTLHYYNRLINQGEKRRF